MFNRCYVGSSEQSLLERSCGIPQYYDRHKEACVSQSAISTGVFLKPMLPDGVIFALQNEVQSQIFCKDEQVGKTRKLKGTGVLQLPNGCTLSVIDKAGRVSKVKGQPLYTMVSAGDIELMPNGPLSALYTDVDMNGTRKAASVNAFVEERVSSDFFSANTGEHLVIRTCVLEDIQCGIRALNRRKSPGRKGTATPKVGKQNKQQRRPQCCT